MTRLSHAADEYYEGLQRTPELESSVVTTAVWQVASNSSYLTSCSGNEASHKQQANDDDSKKLLRLKMQRLLLLLLWRRERPPHKRTSVKTSNETGGNGYRKPGK